jgi:serine/threonine-protein kinase
MKGGPLIGTRFGQFRIEAELGSGAMGVVYRAHDERLHRDVALKFISAGLLASPEARKTFHREALALSRLNHPAIATVHDFQSTSERDFLVMEFIPGESLDVRFARGPLPEAEVVAIGIQLAEGLEAAHRAGVIHRDLKPGNLRVTPEGRLKILDFGLAKRLRGDAASVASLTATEPNTLTGTPAYMAPELLRGAPADERSDLYAAGLVLYEAATGQRPFPGLPMSALFEAILNRKPPPPRALNPGVSTALEAVILRCIEKDPARRYASTRDLAEALRGLSGTAAGRSAAAVRRRVTPGVVIAAALVVLSVPAAYWAWLRLRPGAPMRASEIRSLAVLPLGNLSGDPEQEYFADGLTEELIAHLSTVRALRVISLTSAMRYKKTRRSMPEIANELGVDGVIEGSVLKSGNRLRTTVHLIAARDDRQLWSGQYDGDTSDVLGLQSRMAWAVVREIRVRVSPVERERLPGERRVDPVAHELYLRGRYQWNKRSDAGIRLAIDYFQRAVLQDSLYALAYAGLADAWAAAGLYGVISPIEARKQAIVFATRATALDPDLNEAHTSLGNILHNFDWNWDAAEQEYDRAISLNPSNAVAHQRRAHLLAQRGRFDDAREELKRARELDPLSVAIVLAGGTIEYYARDYDAALGWCQRSAELDSTNWLLHRITAAVLDRQGHEPQAMAELARSFELRGQPEVATALTRAYHASGRNAALMLLVGGLEKKRASGAYQPAEHVAELYSRMGNVDEAFRWLDVAFREHDTELNRLGVDPIFDPLRADPRYAGLLRRVGLPAPVARL